MTVDGIREECGRGHLRCMRKVGEMREEGMLQRHRDRIPGAINAFMVHLEYLHTVHTYISTHIQYILMKREYYLRYRPSYPECIFVINYPIFANLIDPVL